MSWKKEVKKEASIDADYNTPTNAKDYERLRWRKAFIRGANWARPKWISVEERLPEPFEDVVAKAKDDAGTFYDIDCWRGERWESGRTVTHWMQIPEPPEDEG